METKDFVLGYGAGKNSAVSEKIVEEVDAWLDEHITNPDSPPLDRSLTSSSAAAPADLVGDISDTVSDVRNTLNHKADIIYDTASGDIASFPDGADGMPVKDLTVAIEPVQSGTGDPSPTNVRPISGWTGCNVTRTGKNLIGYMRSRTNQNVAFTYNQQTGGVTVDGATSGSAGVEDTSGSKANYPYYPAGQYRIVCNIAETGVNYNVAVYYDGGTTEEYIIDKDTASVTITLTDRAIIMPRMAVRPNTSVSNKTYYPMLMLASDSDTSFEAYKGTTLPISWQSEAGTVYGGTLDVTTDVLTVTHHMMQLPANISKLSTNIYYFLPHNSQGSDFKKAIGNANVICNMLKTDHDRTNLTVSGSKSTAAIYCRDNSCEDGDSFKSKYASATFVYELDSPIVYNLTPTEVITALLGQNNIWTDCGPVEVEYPCDTKLYIQKINTPTDDDMIADANIASGQYFIVNNNLYISTAAILAGDPIKPGTNCTLTNLAAALNAINS